MLKKDTILLPENEPLVELGVIEAANWFVEKSNVAVT
jgi:hypothetical protein